MKPETMLHPQIISASRRTDIPAWHMEWFMRSLEAGEVTVKAPYSEKIITVSLKPGDVPGFVFWSKNYRPLLPHLDRIEAVSPNFYFHFTITGAPMELEPHSPPPGEAVKDFIHLARRFSPGHVMWRFDPLCITDGYSFEQHLERFNRIAGDLEKDANACTISFVQPYAKVLRNFKRQGAPALVDLTAAQKQDYSGRLAKAAGEHGIRLLACCNDLLLSDRIGKAHCIDEYHLSELRGIPISAPVPFAPTRKECGCTRSLDIGAYGTCRSGCLYCYASS
jgi:hypothetical protein